MRRIVITGVLTVLLAGSALAQTGGYIGIYTDNPGFSDDCLVEALFAPNNVYVVHTIAVQASIAQFKVQDNWGALHAGENYGPNLFLASTGGYTIYEGGTIAYVGCKPLPHLLVTLTLIPIAATPQCTATLDVVPDPVLPSGHVEVVACDGSTVMSAVGGWLRINTHLVQCPCAYAVEESTWGRVKALY